MLVLKLTLEIETVTDEDIEEIKALLKEILSELKEANDSLGLIYTK